MTTATLTAPFGYRELTHTASRGMSVPVSCEITSVCGREVLRRVPMQRGEPVGYRTRGRLHDDLPLSIDSKVPAFVSGIAPKKTSKHDNVRVGSFPLRTSGALLDVRGDKVIRRISDTAKRTRSGGAAFEEAPALRRLLRSNIHDALAVGGTVHEDTVAEASLVGLYLDPDNCESCRCEIPRDWVKIALVHPSVDVERGVRFRLSEAEVERNICQHDRDVERGELHIEDSTGFVPVPDGEGSRSFTGRSERDAEAANGASRVVHEEVPGTCLVHPVPAGDCLVAPRKQRCPNDVVVMPELPGPALIYPPRSCHARSLLAVVSGKTSIGTPFWSVGRGRVSKKFAVRYFLAGTKREQVKQAGNAVTPPAARDLGMAVAEALTGVERERTAV